MNFTITIVLFANTSFSQTWSIYNTLNSEMLKNEVRAIAFQQDTTVLIDTKNECIGKFKNTVWQQTST